MFGCHGYRRGLLHADTDILFADTRMPILGRNTSKSMLKLNSLVSGVQVPQSLLLPEFTFNSDWLDRVAIEAPCGSLMFIDGRF